MLSHFSNIYTPLFDSVSDITGTEAETFSFGSGDLIGEIIGHIGSDELNASLEVSIEYEYIDYSEKIDNLLYINYVSFIIIIVILGVLLGKIFWDRFRKPVE